MCSSDLFHRRLAYKFSVGVNIEGILGLDLRCGGFEIFDFANLQVPARVNAREQARQPESAHIADDAYVEQSVVHFRPRGDFHAAAVKRSIGEGREDGGLITAHGPRLRSSNFLIFLMTSGPRENFHRKWGERKDSWGKAERIAAVSTEPSRQLIGSAGDVPVEADSGYTAKVASGES